MDILKILDATRFAALKHKDQRRKDHRASPYIVHPITAAELLVEAGIEDEKPVIAALLHDTMEDTETSYEELVEYFGKKIANIVEEVTVKDTGNKAVDKRREIEDAKNLSPEAALVRVADKICNLQDVLVDTPVGWTEERRDRYILWAEKVILAADINNDYLLDEFKRVISVGKQKFGLSLD